MFETSAYLQKLAHSAPCYSYEGLLLISELS